MFDYDTKEKEHQKSRQSDQYTGVTSPCINQIGSFYYYSKYFLENLICMFGTQYVWLQSTNLNK
jgi:hypothetical protein